MSCKVSLAIVLFIIIQSLDLLITVSLKNGYKTFCKHTICITAVQLFMNHALYNNPFYICKLKFGILIKPLPIQFPPLISNYVKP